VTEWQGKKIIFPDDLIFTRYITDTTDYQIPDSEYKVLVYVDSLGCLDCKLQLNVWKSFIERIDSLTQEAIPFLFFFNNRDYREVNFLLKQNKFDLPVCIDIDDKLNRLNSFPQNIAFQTFLLDRDDKIVLIGNPILNLHVGDLYLKQITGKKDPSDEIIQTTAKVIQNDIDLGVFPKGEKRKMIFNLMNTGDNPLVIFGITASCGCVLYKYDKRPAFPQEKLKIEVEIMPKGDGFFNESIIVKSNTADNIKLKIKGHVK